MKEYLELHVHAPMELFTNDQYPTPNEIHCIIWNVYTTMGMRWLSFGYDMVVYLKTKHFSIPVSFFPKLSSVSKISSKLAALFSMVIPQTWQESSLV